jgi:hypothetical protein
MAPAMNFVAVVEQFSSNVHFSPSPLGWKKKPGCFLQWPHHCAGFLDRVPDLVAVIFSEQGDERRRIRQHHRLEKAFECRSLCVIELLVPDTPEWLAKALVEANSPQERRDSRRRKAFD